MAIKARDVRVILKEKGFERGAVEILEELADAQTQTVKDIRQMALYLDQILSILNTVTSVAENMKTVTERLQTKEREIDGH